MTGVRRAPLAAALLASLGLTSLGLTGCVTLPDGGEVRAQPGGVLPTGEGLRYLPPGPAAGASAADVVAGFVDAMQASPVQTSTAREFLTRRAALDWQPQRKVVVYDDVAVPTAKAPGTLVLSGAAWVDGAGRWRGPLGKQGQRIELGLAREKGEWRIERVPDVFLARSSWFTREYGQFQAHFLDPSRRVLVPEPVFVPRGDQLATALVRSLLAGPSDPDAPWLVNRLAGLSLASGAVTIVDGTARIDLAGAAALPTPDTRAELAAQLAWTLRQVDGLRTLQVRIDDTPLTLEGGLTEIPVGHGALYDPALATADDGLYGLRDGKPVRLDDGKVEVLAGPLASAYRLRVVAVDLDGARAAGVRADGSQLRIAPLEEKGGVVTVRGSDLGRPVWDGAGRLWVLDRHGGSAAFSAVVGGRVTSVEVPGLSGRAVSRILVSRDGTRLVASVRQDGGDAVVVSRVHWSAGQVEASPARRIGQYAGLRDLAWEGPTRLLALTWDGTASWAGSVALDGAPDGLRTAAPPETLFDDARHLVSSGADGAPVWAETADGELLAFGQGRGLAVTGVRALTWAG